MNVKRPKNLILLLCLLFLQSCVVEDYIISQLDYFITKQTRERLHLPHKYQRILRKDIKQLINRHKGMEKQLITELNKMDVNSIKINPILKVIRSSYKVIAIDYSKILAKYLSKLSPSEQRRFFRDEDKENEKIKKWLTQQQPESYTKRYEFFMGDLTAKQIELINSISPLQKVRGESRLNRRLEIQKKFKAIFAKDTNQENKEKDFFDLFKKYNSAKETPIDIAQRAKIIQTVEKVLASATVEQKKSLLNKRDLFVRWLEKFSKTESY